jgi:hypothetical protein
LEPEPSREEPRVGSETGIVEGRVAERVRKFEQEPSAPEAELPREEPGIEPKGIEAGYVAEQKPSVPEVGAYAKEPAVSEISVLVCIFPPPLPNHLEDFSVFRCSV